MKKRVLLALIVATLCLAGCASKEATEPAGFLPKADLEDSELYVHNVMCSKDYETRIVTDLEFLKKIIDISVTAERFRPVISRDIILGERPDVYYILDDGKVKYTFSFFHVERQLDIEFVHRDNPLIIVSKAAEDGDKWTWYCSLSAADYAELYETIQRYSEGDIVK